MTYLLSYMTCLVIHVDSIMNLHGVSCRRFLQTWLEENFVLVRGFVILFLDIINNNQKKKKKKPQLLQQILNKIGTDAIWIAIEIRSMRWNQIANHTLKWLLFKANVCKHEAWIESVDTSFITSFFHNYSMWQTVTSCLSLSNVLTTFSLPFAVSHIKVMAKLWHKRL